MNTVAVKVISSILTVLILILAAKWVIDLKQERDSLKQTVEQNTRTNTAASGITGDISDAGEGAKEDQKLIIESRVIYQQDFEEAKRNDQVLSDWADSDTPERMLILARERRIARERGLGCVGDGCGDNGSEPGPSR